MKQSKWELIQQKQVAPDQISSLLYSWAGKKVVFTNGCFDILHQGHIYLLSKAADLGDKLIVGLNSDESVKRLKGSGRPINPESTRTLVLSALEMVDAVIVFEEDTPLQLIQKLQPDILVKGGDYFPESVVGADIVRSRGGSVVIVDYIPGQSTTAIAEKMKNT